MEEYKAIGSTDVSAFLRAFFAFIKSIIIYTLASVRKYFLPAIATFVLALSAGYYFRSIQKPYYESQMVCEFANVTKKSIGEEIVKLDKLVQSGSFNALANTLNISENQAQDILSIDAKNMVGSPLHEDITDTENPIYINVKASSNTVFKPLETALLNYLNNVSPFRSRRDQMELGILESAMKFLNKDIRQTDSIISAYGNFLHRTLAVTDSAAGFSNIAALMKYKNELEAKHGQNQWRIKELEYKVELLHGFLPTDYPTQTAGFSWKMAVPLALLAACAMAIFCNLLLVKNTVANIAEVETEAEIAV